MTVVVKLGGSLADAGTLRSWLRVVRADGGGRCVVVPGGGVFADAVRSAQQRLAFSDAAAHKMALLAMEQYAVSIADLQPGLRACAHAEEIATALRAAHVALWLPYAMITSDPGVAASWSVTSDSLAAWLARRIGAKRLVLIKSAPRPVAAFGAKHLADGGLVDAAFPVYFAMADCSLEYCGPGDEARLVEALRRG